jgi:hypothetical protein
VIKFVVLNRKLEFMLVRSGGCCNTRCRGYTRHTVRQFANGFLLMKPSTGSHKSFRKIGIEFANLCCVGNETFIGRTTWRP